MLPKTFALKIVDSLFSISVFLISVTLAKVGFIKFWCAVSEVATGIVGKVVCSSGLV